MKDINTSKPFKATKKPLEVRAIKWTGHNFNEVTNFTNGNFRMIPMNINNVGIIDTLEGQKKVEIGHFIVEGIKNSFYPCTEEEFNRVHNIMSDDD